MCTFREGLWRRAVEQGEAQGLSKGIEQGTLNNLKNNLKSLMKNQAGLDLEQAMDLLDVPQQLRDKIRLEIH